MWDCDGRATLAFFGGAAFVCFAISVLETCNFTPPRTVWDVIVNGVWLVIVTIMYSYYKKQQQRREG